MAASAKSRYSPTGNMRVAPDPLKKMLDSDRADVLEMRCCGGDAIEMGCGWGDVLEMTGYSAIARRRHYSDTVLVLGEPL